MFKNVSAVALILFTALYANGQAGSAPKRTLNITETASPIHIDGLLSEEAWSKAAVANNFTEFQPTPFRPEDTASRSEVRFLYSNAGVYVGGFMHEQSKDSITAELNGRDGFGNNDFIGVIFDTYNDHLNGFEYFVTPLNEQWDAKTTGGSEDFSWNAVWRSAVKRRNDGWSFEMFIPYSAIRFGGKKLQDWGLNVVRYRIHSGQKYFWQSLDPNGSGILTQEGLLKGFQDIKPPVRLQLSPYFSTYYNKGGLDYGIKSGVSTNGGMDVKYGINQAFTLDMTLVPDFGQVQTDNLNLNLSPFEVKYSENRPFFTEGTELFNKGNLFYSRRIGGAPIHYNDYTLAPGETLVDNPAQSKLINATKISGRTQSGLGIGFLNAVTRPQYAVIADSAGTKKFETDPLTNYNVFVLDQTLKHNSSVSFVNTSVLRSGADYDADVAAVLFDFNNKTNRWNGGGDFSMSNIVSHGKSQTGYYHLLYFGKSSGKFTFQAVQELLGPTYNKNDLGYFTSNNSINNKLGGTYHWNTPKAWYNRMNISTALSAGWLVTPLDYLKRPKNMFETLDFSSDGYAQTKKLWEFDYNFHYGSAYNDFYEPREKGRFWHNRGSKGISLFVQTNSTKKFSGSLSLFTGEGGIFRRTSFSPGAGLQVRFSDKFSVGESVNVEHDANAAGFTAFLPDLSPTRSVATDTILFARRNVDGVENVFSMKYSFNNRMGVNLRVRHSWTKVAPVQLYQLDTNGQLQTLDRAFPDTYRQNYNFFSLDMSYNWEFRPGSFVTVSWKQIGSADDDIFRPNYAKNLEYVVSGQQFSSVSVKLIYFLDYAAIRAKMAAKARRAEG